MTTGDRHAAAPPRSSCVHREEGGKQSIRAWYDVHVGKDAPTHFTPNEKLIILKLLLLLSTMRGQQLQRDMKQLQRDTTLLQRDRKQLQRDANRLQREMKQQQRDRKQLQTDMKQLQRDRHQLQIDANKLQRDTNKLQWDTNNYT